MSRHSDRLPRGWRLPTREEGEVLARAAEAGHFDHWPTRDWLYKKAAALLGVAEVGDEAVERFLGERAKANVFGHLYTRFSGYKDLVGQYARPNALDGWWAMLAASRALDRRRVHELTLRAKKRREVAARREKEGFSRRWRRER